MCIVQAYTLGTTEPNLYIFILNQIQPLSYEQTYGTSAELILFALFESLRRFTSKADTDIGHVCLNPQE